MKYLRPTIIGLLALAALLALFAQGQPAYAATFTVTKTADTNDGVCDGDCSLREAIGAANAAAGADTITVPAGTYTLSIAGTGEDANATGDLDISDDLTINGASAATTIVDGGALDRIFEIVAGNTVEIADVTVRNGSVGATTGGGINNRGTLTLNNSTVSDNSSVHGGGIVNNGTMTINNSTISGNTADGSGGGIRNNDTMTINNSTISGNSAPGFGGGGIINVFSGATLNLNNSTVSGNSTGGSVGGINVFNGTLTLKNTIVANNSSGGDCGGSGAFTSLGYNLDSDNTCNLTATGDLPSGTANLGALANNGGPTQTHALLAGSDAIDAGNPATPGSGGDACLATDQRGVSRPQGSTCDIGAFELEAGVGGIAEVLVGGGEAPASTGAGSGSSSLLYAALAGVVAAGALAIAAAGWYARRRWLR